MRSSTRPEVKHGIQRVASPNPVADAIDLAINNALIRLTSLKPGSTERRSVIKDMFDLADWAEPAFYRQPPAEQSENIKRWFDQLSDKHDAGLLQEAVERAKRRPKGHPVEKRHVTRQALELRILHPELKRQQITERFCPCKQSSHDVDCQRAIFRDVTRLRTMLLKYRVTFSISNRT
jgi:hypothetical protein